MSQYQYELLHIDDEPLEAQRFDTLKEARFIMSIRSGMEVIKTSKGWECNYSDGYDDEASHHKTQRDAYFDMSMRSGYCIYKVRRD
tara:strand:+ start:253 stop:510 length:258 start_codon:yes stop_codon:yes gene_type:complete